MRNGNRGVLQNWQDVGVNGIVRYWKTHMPDSFQMAQQEFVQLVDPFVSHATLPRGRDSEITNMVFSEWLAYDHHVNGGLTPLELYIEALENKGRSQISADLAQVACSQFFSEFWVCWQRPSERLSLLEDAFTGRSYLLSDAQVATNPRWTEGLVALRIACVDDEWFDVGIAPMHDNYPSRADYTDDFDRLVKEHPEGAVSDASGRGISYLAFARQLIGSDGGYLPSVEIHYYIP